MADDATKHCTPRKLQFVIVSLALTLGGGVGVGSLMPCVPPGDISVTMIVFIALAPITLVALSVVAGCRGHGTAVYFVLLLFLFWLVSLSAAGAVYREDSQNWLLVLYFIMFYGNALVFTLVLIGAFFWKRGSQGLGGYYANLSIGAYFGLFGMMMVAGMYGASLRNEIFAKHFGYDISVVAVAQERDKYGWTFTDGVVLFDQLNGTMRSIVDAAYSRVIFAYTCIAPVVAVREPVLSSDSIIAFWVAMQHNFTGQPQTSANAVCSSLDLSLWSTPKLGALALSSFDATIGLELLAVYAPTLEATTLINDTLYQWTNAVEGPGVTPSTALAIVGSIMSVLVVIGSLNTLCWIDTSVLVQNIPLKDAFAAHRPGVPAGAGNVEAGAGTTTAMGQADAAAAAADDPPPDFTSVVAGDANKTSPVVTSPSKTAPAAGASASTSTPSTATRQGASFRFMQYPAAKAAGKAPVKATPTTTLTTPGTSAAAGKPAGATPVRKKSPSSAADADEEGESPPRYEDDDGDKPDGASGSESNTPAISLLVLLPNGTKRLFAESLPTLEAVKAEMNVRFSLGTEDFILEHYTDDFEEWVEIGHIRELPVKGRFRIRLVAASPTSTTASATNTTSERSKIRSEAKTTTVDRDQPASFETTVFLAVSDDMLTLAAEAGPSNPAPAAKRL